MRAKNIIHSSHHASNGSTTPLLIRGAHRCVEWERDDHETIITMHGHVPDGRRASERRQKFWVPVASVRRLAVCLILANSEEDTLHSSHFPSGEKKQEREWLNILKLLDCGWG